MRSVVAESVVISSGGGRRDDGALYPDVAAEPIADNDDDDTKASVPEDEDSVGSTCLSAMVEGPKSSGSPMDATRRAGSLLPR